MTIIHHRFGSLWTNWQIWSTVCMRLCECNATPLTLESWTSYRDVKYRMLICFHPLRWRLFHPAPVFSWCSLTPMMCWKSHRPPCAISCWTSPQAKRSVTGIGVQSCSRALFTLCASFVTAGNVGTFSHNRDLKWIFTFESQLVG